MNTKKLKKYIFDPENSNKIKFIFGLSLSIIMSYFFLSSKKTTIKEQEIFQKNINVLIPKDHVLFPFTAQNYEEVDALLDSYSLVKVYDSEKGGLLAENIKVLRAPKNPQQLAFLIPSSVANVFMRHGMDFRLALQKFTNQKSKLITNAPTRRVINTKVVTYGE